MTALCFYLRLTKRSQLFWNPSCIIGTTRVTISMHVFFLFFKFSLLSLFIHSLQQITQFRWYFRTLIKLIQQCTSKFIIQMHSVAFVRSFNYCMLYNESLPFCYFLLPVIFWQIINTAVQPCKTSEILTSGLDGYGGKDLKMEFHGRLLTSQTACQNRRLIRKLNTEQVYYNAQKFYCSELGL